MTVGTPYLAPILATPTGPLSNILDRSVCPSPVIIKSDDSMLFSNPKVPATISIPECNSPLRNARIPAPNPPAAPEDTVVKTSIFKSRRIISAKFRNPLSKDLIPSSVAPF